MNRFKLILKGILLWTTAFVTVLFIAGIDSIYDNGYFFLTTIVAVMIFCCYKLISEEEFKKVTFYNLLKLDEDESYTN